MLGAARRIVAREQGAGLATVLRFASLALIVPRYLQAGNAPACRLPLLRAGAFRAARCIRDDREGSTSEDGYASAAKVITLRPVPTFR
jgi:hypothetical protein